MGWYTSLASLVVVLAAAAVLLPTPEEESDGSTRPAAVWVRCAHLLSASAAFGCSLWTTFIAGIVLFRALPRHQFGTVQSHLFPAYFRFVAAADSIALLSFAAMHPFSSSTPSLQLQSAALGLSLLCVLLNLLLLEPVTSKVMKERHVVERAAGIGDEVGLSKNREAAKTNPELRALNKRFGMWHGLSSLSNLIALVALGVHLSYVAAAA